LDNIRKKVLVSSYYNLKYLPLLVLAATLLLHPLASASCAVNMISTATTITKPNAAIREKTTNVEFVSKTLNIL
jgi:hypothetical protein